MQITADLQIHSKYSRAVSKHMTFPNMVSWGKKKGIDLMATGDWTHPLWMKEIVRDLEEVGNGLLRLKTQESEIVSDPLFLLATEVSCIFSQGGKGRRVHTLIWVPTIASAMAINKEMAKQGCNLMSDGRPIIGLSSIQVCELVFTIEPTALVIPAHAWTPWFALYGGMSGFDSLSDAFGPYADQIYAVETGLSSDPAMNWRITELDNRSIVSFSDAHSMQKLGREATVFDLQELSYEAIRQAIMRPHRMSEDSDNEKPISKNRIAYTIEFYPEEGKYHYTGHRTCHVRMTPDETNAKGNACPVCGKPMTQGVMQRVEELAGRSEAALKLAVVNSELSDGVEISMTKSEAFPDRPPFVRLVPLVEIIAECLEKGVGTKGVVEVYERLCTAFGGELRVLLSTSIDEIRGVAGDRIAEGIGKVRSGDIVIDPGYDGVFGVVKLWRDDEEKPLVDASKEQLSMF